MTYKTLMVHLEVGKPNAGLLRIAGELSDRFDAGIIGVAVCQPIEITSGATYISGEILQEERDEIEREIKEAEAEFRAALMAPGRDLAWRSAVMFGSLANFIAHEARRADLVITGVAPTDLLDTSRLMNIGDLVMQAGRPVLIVPPAANRFKLERVILAWKDTREARRAALDALPLLKMAAQIIVVDITTEDRLAEANMHLDDVVEWLGRHGVKAKPLALFSNGDDADQLNAIARDERADIIVAGAYGHSRLREWALGGVTRDLLLYGAVCSLVSH